VTLSAKAGAHRYFWDLHYDPIGEYGAYGIGGGATPGRHFPAINSPWAAPGNYTVRLTANGARLSQPIVVRLDPRVKLPPLVATTLTTLTRDLYRSAQDARAAYEKARALSAKLDGNAHADARTLKARIDSLAPAVVAGAGGGRGGGRGFGVPGATSPTLANISGTLVAAINAMQTADMVPTTARLDAARKAQADAATVIQRWNTLNTVMLNSLNAKLRAAGQTPIAPPAVRQ
jgi:mannitol-specific phosphotransferase system IIBC component